MTTLDQFSALIALPDLLSFMIGSSCSLTFAPNSPIESKQQDQRIVVLIDQVKKLTSVVAHLFKQQ